MQRDYSFTEFEAELTALENAIRKAALERQREADETDADVQIVEVLQ